VVVKKNRYGVGVLVMLMAAGTSLVYAQAPAATTAVATKVGVIQIQSALAATKEGQKAAAEMETKFAPRKKELEAKQAELNDMKEKLQKGSLTLSDSAKDELTRGIDSKTKSYNRDIEDAQAELEAEQQKIINVLGQKMMQVVDKYAQSNGYSVVLDVSNQNTPVLYASNSVDITKEVIDLYDKTVFTPTTNAAPAARPVPAPVRTAAPPPATPRPAAAPASTATKKQ
jgi:outer membrane protein